MKQIENKPVQYIWHDGVRISENQLLSMAKNASTYEEAKCYLISIMAHGLINGFNDYINKVNEVRAHFMVTQIPIPMHQTMAKNNHLSEFETQLMQVYQRLPESRRIHLLQTCLNDVMTNHATLFKKKKHWQAVYMVFRDRLDYGLKMTTFCEMAHRATPQQWPDELKISQTVFKNYSRDVGPTDEEAYYEMTYNPHRSFCEEFWEVVKHILKDF